MQYKAVERFDIIESDILGIYELRDGHVDPERILRSDQHYRTLFGEKFYEYFI